MPLFYGRNKREEQKGREFRMAPNPPGVPVFFFGAPELCSLQTACLTVTSQRHLPPTRPLSKTRGWEARLSLTQFSQFSALVCDGKRMKAWSCAVFWKARVRVESPSQMALCRTMAAAPNSHRWRAQEGKRAVASEQKTWKKCLVPYETRHLMCVDSIRVHAHLRFCFHLLPCHRSLVFAHGKAASDCCKTKIKTVRWKERSAITLTLSDSSWSVCRLFWLKTAFFFPKPIVFIFIAVISSYQIEKHNEIRVCFSMIDALLPQR